MNTSYSWGIEQCHTHDYGHFEKDAWQAIHLLYFSNDYSFCTFTSPLQPLVQTLCEIFGVSFAENFLRTGRGFLAMPDLTYARWE